MRCVAFLPKELGRAEEETGTHLPAHDVRPLVHQDGQVAVALDPFGIHVIDDRLGGRPDHIRLFELLAACLSHHRKFRSKPLNMLLLALNEAHWDQKREVCVLMSSLLEHVVQSTLHEFYSFFRSIVVRQESASRRKRYKAMDPGTMNKNRDATTQVDRKPNPDGSPVSHATTAPPAVARSIAPPMMTHSRISRRRIARLVTRLAASAASRSALLTLITVSRERSPAPHPSPYHAPSRSPAQVRLGRQ